MKITTRFSVPQSCVRRILCLVAIACIGICTWGCKDKDKAPARQSVKLLLDWKTGAEHAFLHLGKKKGLFRGKGLSLQIVPGTGSADSANMVDAGSVDFALCSGETALKARSAQTPRDIVVLAVFYPTTPTVIYSLEAKNIKKPEDLYGKRLGLIKGSSAARNYDAFARKVRLDRSKITEVPCTGDLREIIADDAPLDAMVHFEFQHPLQLKLENYKVSVIRLRDFGIQIYGQGLITSRDTIEQRQDLCRRVTQAVQASYSYSISHPTEALEVFLAGFPEKDRAYSQAKLDWVNSFVRSATTPGKPLGQQSTAGWNATQSYLREQGLLDREITLEGFWTNDFLDPKITLP